MEQNESCCVVCDGKGMRIQTRGKYGVYRCKTCGLEFVNPMPNDEELNEFYLNYSDPRAIERIVKKNSIKNASILAKYGLTKEKRLLDFGCGNNFFVKEAGGENWQGYDKYTLPQMPPGKFDFITLWGVLEHLVSPVKIVEYLAEKLELGGIIVITTVGTETPIPYQYKPPEHVTWWSKKSVRELFQKCGLKEREISSYFMYQDPRVYLNCVLNAGRVPEDLKKEININIEEDILVPTNEIFIVGQKENIQER